MLTAGYITFSCLCGTMGSTNYIMRRKLTIFITGAGTTTTLSVIKGLRKQKEFPVRILSADMDDFVSGRYLSDGFYKIPSPDTASFIPQIITIIKKEHVDIFIPIVDYEFFAFVDHKKEFEKNGCAMIISSKNTIETCMDKFKTMKSFDTIGIAHPRSFTVKEIQTGRPHFPLFIKPSLMGRASVDAYKLDDIHDLKYYTSKIQHPIIQEYIDGQEITTDAMNTLDGKYIFSVSRTRLQAKNGVSVKGKIFTDPKLTEQIKRITEHLQIIGPCNIQCFSTKKGYVFSEVNPRFSGAGALSLHGGFNSPHLLLKLYKGQKINPKTIHVRNVSMIRYWEEIIIDNKTITLPKHLRLPK
jgi:carbamoyl-phosphate synthase large subunit